MQLPLVDLADQAADRRLVVGDFGTVALQPFDLRERFLQAFLGVQLAVFGVYMGASFAPNHKGMPLIDRDAKLDFFTKQVRTSRNVSGGWWATTLMGGLNYQIEHHLFPSMPRPHLSKARVIVKRR